MLDNPSILGEVGRRVLMMGNEAIARGAIEAGIKVATAYPGTPSTEIVETLARVAKNLDIHVEWAVNEKVALEIALGAAFSGVRALVAMKAPGLNVAMDALMSATYSGVNGGLVIIVADDPGPHTTQTEQDNRFMSKVTLLPMLEPSDPQEAKDMVKEAFKISERLHLPVIVRTTTRVNHTSADVTLGEVEVVKREPWFSKEPSRYIRASMAWNLARHKWLNQQVEKAKEIMENLPFNKLETKGNEKFGVIVSGVSYNYLKEIIKKYGIEDVAVLKIGAINPLPEKLIKELLLKVDRVLVLEELEPYLEFHIRSFIAEIGRNVEVLGKLNGVTPREGEFSPEIVKSALEKLLNKKLGTSQEASREKVLEDIKSILPRRAPPMCPGCPHRATYLALKRAIKRLGLKLEEAPIFGDIGCYALSLQPPLEAIWTEHCMGASIGMAAGLYFSGSRQKAIATIGDSTFFHMGIQPLIDAVQHNANITVIVLDNGTIAMTGHQPHPGSGETATGEKVEPILIENIAKAIGVKFVKVVDPYDLKETTDVLVEALKFEGVSVVVARRLCAILAVRRKLTGPPCYVDPDTCTGCRTCILQLGCPSLVWEGEKTVIDADTCTGCSICIQVCPYNAIKVGKEE